MKGLLRICLFSMVLLIANRAIANTINMNFEEFFHHNGEPLATFYSGVKFEAATTGQDWIAADVTTGLYNASSWPSGSGLGVGVWFLLDVRLCVCIDRLFR